MLINCPECGKQISDKAPACIHCGYPLELIKQDNTCKNKFYLLTSKFIKSGRRAKAATIVQDFTKMDSSDCIKIFNNQESILATGLVLEDAEKIKAVFQKHEIEIDIKQDQLSKKRSILAESAEKTYCFCPYHIVDYVMPEQPDVENPVPTCPKCGSTSITTSARGVDGFWGFLGASSTVNRCANCGHAWYPETGKSI